jgi:hypothetical protein
MATVIAETDIDVEDYLDEASNTSLVNELLNRIKRKEIRSKDMAELNAIFTGIDIAKRQMTLDMVFKLELLEQALNRFSLVELEQRLK